MYQPFAVRLSALSLLIMSNPELRLQKLSTVGLRTEDMT